MRDTVSVNEMKSILTKLSSITEGSMPVSKLNKIKKGSHAASILTALNGTELTIKDLLTKVPEINDLSYLRKYVSQLVKNELLDYRLDMSDNGRYYYYLTDSGNELLNNLQ